jgi:hypothetical protein
MRTSTNPLLDAGDSSGSEMESAHETATSHEGSSDASDSGSDYTDDPRLSLATTATMQTLISDTITAADSADDEESAPRRRAVRLVSGPARLLLPRSSKVAFACSGGCVLLVSTLALILSLTTVETYYSRAAEAFGSSRRLFEVENAATRVSAAAAAYTAAILTADATLQDQQQLLADELVSATSTLRLAVGTGDSTASDAAARTALWWEDARSKAGRLGTAANLSPDVSSCANVVAQNTADSMSALIAAHTAIAAVSYTPPSWSSIMNALGGLSSLHPLLDATRDSELASAAAAAGTPPATRASVESAIQTAVTQFAAAVALLNAPLPSAIPAVVATVSAKAAASITAQSPTLVTAGVAAVQAATALGVWFTNANSALQRLNSSLGGIAGKNTTGANAATLASTYVTAAHLVTTVATTYLPGGIVEGVPATRAAQWFAAASTRQAAASFSKSPIAFLLPQGLANLSSLPLPWLRDQFNDNPRAVTSWFGFSAGLGSPANSTGCIASLAAILAEASAVAAWAEEVVATAAAQDFAYVDGALEDPHRDHLIAILVVGVVAIALSTLYGQWGVATRLSASVLPYRSFVHAWWFLALVMCASVAWCTGLGFREVLDESNAASPRRAFSDPAGQLMKREEQGIAARLFTGLSCGLTPTPPPTLADIVAELSSANATTIGYSSSLQSLVNAVLVPFMSNATLGVSRNADVETELLGDAIFTFALANNSAPGWIPPSLASASSALSSGNTTPSRNDEACAVAFASRSAILAHALTLRADIARSGSIVAATTAASSAATRSGTLADRVTDLTKYALNSSSWHVLTCLASSSSADVAAFNALDAAVGVLVPRALNKATVLARANSRRLTGSTLDVAAFGPQLLPLKTTLLTGSPALTGAVANTTIAAVKDMAALSTSVELALDGVTIPMKRRVVWGHIGACVFTEVLAMLLWRLLFGASWTPY